MPNRIDPWSQAGIKDYGRLIKEFGIEPFRSVLKKVPDPHL